MAGGFFWKKLSSILRLGIDCIIPPSRQAHHHLPIMNIRSLVIAGLVALASPFAFAQNAGINAQTTTQIQTAAAVLASTTSTDQQKAAAVQAGHGKAPSKIVP